MKPLKDALDEVMKAVETRATPWEPAGERRDDLLGVLWNEIHREKKTVPGSRLQRMDFDVLHAILKVMSPGEFSGVANTNDLLRAIGLESTGQTQSRLTYCFKRLWGFLTSEFVPSRGMGVAIPYLMPEINAGTAEHLAIRHLARYWDLPELKKVVETAGSGRIIVVENMIVRQPVDFHLSYKEYLLSDHWLDLRRKILKRDGFACRLCNARTDLNVHHRSYERIGREREDDLITLCRRCHEIFHRNRALDRSETDSLSEAHCDARAP
jgi:5-methylcytosine-specific restriction endonuclease McrA